MPERRSGACCSGVCAPSTTQCSGNGVQTCGSDGQWGTAAACTNQTCVSGACTGACAPGQARCSGNQPQTCSAGAWQNSGTACTISCSAGQCTGPECRAADGGTYFCGQGQHCCVSASTQDSLCAATCTAPHYAVDCAGSANTSMAVGQCGSQLCCGQLYLSGGTVPNCTASELTASCASSCSDTPPAANSMCMDMNAMPYIVRLCTAKADCASDTGKTNCCKFGSSPIYWCVDNISSILGTCM